MTNIYIYTQRVLNLSLNSSDCGLSLSSPVVSTSQRFAIPLVLNDAARHNQIIYTIYPRRARSIGGE